METGRIQTYIAAATLLAGLVGVYASLNARITALEAQIVSIEANQREYQATMTGEMIELIKVTHRLSGEMPRMSTDQRGPR